MLQANWLRDVSYAAVANKYYWRDQAKTGDCTWGCDTRQRLPVKTELCLCFGATLTRENKVLWHFGWGLGAFKREFCFALGLYSHVKTFFLFYIVLSLWLSLWKWVKHNFAETHACGFLVWKRPAVPTSSPAWYRYHFSVSPISRAMDMAFKTLPSACEIFSGRRIAKTMGFRLWRDHRNGAWWTF